MKVRIVVLACVAMLASATSAKAQQEVKIGVLYPLSGPTAQIGVDAVAAVKTAVEIVNEGADLPLTLRGLKYFFRTSPTDETFSQLMFDFLKDFGAKSGQMFQSVSIFHEDTA